MKNKKGFTLVELLVVIAIIGILSSVAIVNLNSARDKARSASVQAALSQISSAAILCQDDGVNLAVSGVADPIVVCADTQAPLQTGLVCDDTKTEAVWPTLPTGWYYQDDCSSSYTNSTWDFTACEGTAPGTCSLGGRQVVCDQAGCVVGTVTSA